MKWVEYKLKWFPYDYTIRSDHTAQLDSKRQTLKPKDIKKATRASRANTVSVSTVRQVSGRREQKG